MKHNYYSSDRHCVNQMIGHNMGPLWRRQQVSHTHHHMQDRKMVPHIQMMITVVLVDVEHNQPNQDGKLLFDFFSSFNTFIHVLCIFGSFLVNATFEIAL
jgi:hypothetical protein